MKNTGNHKYINVIIHIIAWGLLFCSPLMFSGATGKQLTFGEYVFFTGTPLAHIVIFYINFFFLINHLLFKRRIGTFILINIGLVVLALLFQSFWWELNLHSIQSLHLGGHQKGIPPPRTFIFLRDSLMFILTAALSVAIKVTANWYKTENERKEIEKEKSEAVLKNLKSQLNPHFLFNTLNNIYSLISINPKQAQDSVHGLSNLLRYVLYDNNEEIIPLNKELGFMKSYIELMSLRIHDKVKLYVDIKEDNHRIFIAPLLFITLVENAFKHGISPIEESVISIEIYTEEHKKNNTYSVVCKISNSNHPKSDNDRSGSGIGIKNLKKRLELLYPDNHILTSHLENNMYTTLLEINLPK